MAEGDITIPKAVWALIGDQMRFCASIALGRQIRPEEDLEMVNAELAYKVSQLPQERGIKL